MLQQQGMHQGPHGSNDALLPAYTYQHSGYAYHRLVVMTSVYALKAEFMNKSVSQQLIVGHTSYP